VQEFRNQDWCQNIYYKRGAFSNKPTTSTCNLFDQQALDFDEKAREDFNSVSKSFKTLIGDVAVLESTFDQTGKLQYAEVQMECFSCTILNKSANIYVYQPGYKNVPESIPGEIVYTKIDEDWFIIEVD
jgi:hypothetical protein